MTSTTGPSTDPMSEAEALPQLDASSLVDGERLEAEVKSMYRRVALEDGRPAPVFRGRGSEQHESDGTIRTAKAPSGSCA